MILQKRFSSKGLRLFGIALSSCCLLLFSTSAYGQLSGSYTIGPSGSADYTTFNDAVDDLQAQGVGGAVNFDFEPGTYNEGVILEDISGLSNSDSLVFDGGHRDSVEIVSDSTTILIEETDHVTLQNLTIESTSGDEHNEAVRAGVNSSTFAHDINIWDCRLIKDIGAGTDLNANVMRSFGENHSIKNNEFDGGPGPSYLIWASDDIYIKNNHMHNNRYGGITLINSGEIIIHDNLINNPSEMWSLWRGIWVYGLLGGIDRMEAKRNEIYEAGRSGITMDNVSSDASNPSEIYNNLITSGYESGIGPGIEVDDVQNAKIIYNSVYHHDDEGIEVEDNSEGIMLLNNSFASSSNPVATIEDGSSIDSSDHNNFDGDIDFEGSTYSDVSDYAASSGFDNNSVSGDPEYVDIDTDLRATGPVLYQNAIPVPDIQVDAVGQSRDGTDPSIGGYEILDYDIEMVELYQPDDITECGSVEEELQVVVRNLGGQEITSDFDFYVDVEGDFSESFSTNFDEGLDGFSDDDTINVGTINTREGGVADITLYHDFADDQNPMNDTLQVEREFLFTPEAPTAENDTTCGAPGQLQLEANVDDPNVDVKWYQVEEGGTLAHTGETFGVDLDGPATFYVEAEETEEGCSSERVQYNVVAHELPEVGVAPGDEFTGSFRGGSEDSPDKVCEEAAIEYDLEAPFGFSNDDYDDHWTITDYSLHTDDAAETPAQDFDLIEPSGGDNGVAEFTPDESELGESFKLTIEVEDLDTECEGTVNHYIDVVAAPEADFNIVGSGTCVGEIFELENNSVIADDQDMNFTVNFDDGRVVSTEDLSSIDHQYNEAGDYEIDITVDSEYGCTDTEQINVEVGEFATADFEVGEAEFCEDEELEFTNNSEVHEDQSLDFTWDFGDGSTSEDEEPTHTYDESGSYEVSLVAETYGQCNDTMSRSVDVKALPEAEMQMPEELCVDEEGQFSPGQGAVGNFEWEFDDGEVSNERSPLHSYNEAGTYTVTLTVASDQGCESEYTGDVEVPEIPESEFESEAVGGQLSFSAVNENLASYEWQLGDGTTTDEVDFTHTYDEDGFYDVTLTVTDEAGCESTTTEEVGYWAASLADQDDGELDWGIYPNPADDFVNVSFDLREEAEVEITLYNNLGQEVEVSQVELMSAGSHEIRLDNLDDLSSGVYFLELNTGSESVTQPLRIRE